MPVGSIPNNDKNGGGEWGGVFSWPIIGVHAILTPDNKLLTFGTDTRGMQGGHIIYDVWDFETNTHYTLKNKTPTDLFCSVPALVPATGEILISGGDGRFGAGFNMGVNDVNVFDYKDMSLSPSKLGDMAYQRWYPTAVTLGNGKIVMIGGRDGNGNGVGTPEIYTPGEGWKTLDGAFSQTIENDWWYPRAWVNSKGNIVLFDSNGGVADTSDVMIMNPRGNGSIAKVADMPFGTSQANPAIMYQQDKVLILSNGGGLWSMDMSTPVPTFAKVGDVGQPRLWSNMTVLADGSVMISGGSGGDNILQGVANEVAIWDPDTNKVTFGDEAGIPRLYHSTTILLPDATILSLGGGAPGPLTNTNGEVYYPEYLFDENGNFAERPEIIDAPEVVERTGFFTIEVDDASSVSRVTLVKNGSVTHALNMETRMLEPDFMVGAGNTLNINPTNKANVLTPGYWMVFVFDDEGVPSHAATINFLGKNIPDFDPIDDSPMALVGSAKYLDGSREFVLTDALNNKRGAINSEKRIDLGEDFEISFGIYAGSKKAGGEGLSFFLHNDPKGTDAIGGKYGHLGAHNIKNGLAIEFDTYNSGAGSGDIAADHTNFRDTDGGFRSGAKWLGDIEDRAWHAVTVTWDASTQTLKYSVDGVQKGRLTRDLADDFLGGSDFAYFGFGASTGGGAKNNHKVRFTDIFVTYEDGSVSDTRGPTGENLPSSLFPMTTAGASKYSELPDEYILTKYAAKQAGTINSEKQLDLTEDFAIEFELFAGSRNKGGQGLSFILHDDSDGADAHGNAFGALGARGIENGLAIEFDTYKNKGDIQPDHTNFRDTDGTFTSAPQALGGNIENGAWHSVIVNWDASTQTLVYAFDGVERGRLESDVVNEYFGGSDYVHFGFGASTGGGVSKSQHKVRVIDVTATYEDGTSDVGDVDWLLT